MSLPIAEHSFTARSGSVPRASDVALALIVGGVWWALLVDDGGGNPIEGGLVVASTVPLALWRLAPVPSLAVSVAAATALALRGDLQWPPLAPVACLYLVTASGAVPRWLPLRAVLVPITTAALYLAGVLGSGSWSTPDLAHPTLAFAVGWFAGERTRLRRDQVVALHERMHRAAESNAREAQLAVLEERSRIARDLHDSAGHALNVIAIRAGAARLRNDPEPALASLADIEELARDTAADVDRIVGSLRERDDAPRSPISLASADTLIQQHRDAGLAVTTTYDGELPPLSPAGDQAAFRGLQEALTNAARHGTGSAQVTFSGVDGCFSLTVTNPTPATAAPTPSRSAGHGLIGMRERASLLGGTVAVERPPGGFVVRLSLACRRRRPMIRVLVVDDDHLMRAGLRELLTVDPDIAVVGEAQTGRQAVDQARVTTPDVVLMDVRMPDLDGIEATRLVTEQTPECRVVILTTFEQDDYVFGAFRAGASGFLLKRTEPEQLIAAIHTIAAGESLLSPSITRRVIDRLAEHPGHRRSEAHLLQSLTDREREVCLLMAQGLSNREIASRLVVEESTVRTHAKRVLAKLQLRDRVQVVIWAYENGVIAPGHPADLGT